MQSVESGEDVIEGGRMESVEAVREKGKGWEPRIGQIKPQTKEFLSPHETQWHDYTLTYTHTPISRYPTADGVVKEVAPPEL